MEWNGASDKYFITSDKGYRVDITFHSGVKMYTAWPAIRQPDTKMLGTSDTLKGAQEICEIHHQNHVKK
jgi:hypothetical protein